MGVKLLHVAEVQRAEDGKRGRSKSPAPGNVKAPVPARSRRDPPSGAEGGARDLPLSLYDERHLKTAMRYPPAHKEATRRRILEAASQAFRERGVAETGVDEVMRRAGLTHGGFYAHFPDKTALVTEACAAAFDAAVPNLDRIAAAPTAAGRARLLIDSYLGTRHRDNRGSGCVVVAVGADMVRRRGTARTGYARGFAQHLERLAAALRLDPEPRRNRETVTLLMSSLVGALLFARAIDDPAQSDAMLHAMRRHLRRQFCGGAVEAAPAAPAASRPPISTHDFMRAF